MSRLKTFSSVVALATLGTGAANAQPVSVQDAVRLALQNDPALERAEAGIAQSRAGADMARAATGPTAGLRAEVGALETDFTTDSVSQIPRSVGLQAEWNVYSSGANRAAIGAADAYQQAAYSQLASARERTVLQTFEAFAQMQLAERVVDVAEARLETFAIRMRQTEARFEQGEVTRTDTAMTEARLASAEAGLGVAQAQLSAAKARLSRLTGAEDANPVGPASFSTDLLASYETTLNRVLNENSDLEAARAVQVSSGHQLEEARARFGPSVSVRARATRGEEMYFFFGDAISDVGAFVSVEVPLFTNGMRQASERQAIAARSAATADVRDARLQLSEAVSSLWGDLQARRLALDATIRAEAAAELASEGAQREYEAGLRTLVDALEAETEFRDTQIARFQAETNLLVVQARLLSLSNDLEATLSN